MIYSLMNSQPDRIPFSFKASNSSAMTSDRYPVILVHGWNSHPGVWKSLVVLLETAGIPYRRFDHTGMQGSALPEIAE
jgi:pimeloyl-ACP methyl ester carboxylesterase